MTPNRNLLWARLVLDELVRGGVRDVCLSPGSRSAPLAFALAEEPRLRVTVHPDERSGAFVALGLSKASRRPVALLCTSGTAVANYFPAVVEASQSGVPLVVLSADRPPELRGTGANQTIDQERIFGSYVRSYAEAPMPEPAPERLRDLRATVARLVAIATGPAPGPVHLNLPFREPLEPTRVPGDVPEGLAEADPQAWGGRDDGAPFLDERTEAPVPDASVLDRVRPWLTKERGLIVVGPLVDPADAAALPALAHRLAWPLLADPLSGLRGEAGDAFVSTAYDAFLSHATVRERLRPEVVLRFGAAPVSKTLLAYLASCRDVPQATANPLGHTWDVAGDVHVVLRTSVAKALEAVASVAPGRAAGSSSWLQTWTALERATHEALDGAFATLEFEGALVARLAHTLPRDHLLYVSNSLPVRDLDRSGVRLAQRVLGNRGASGIDGILSSAVGAALSGTPTTVIVGDLAFLHDLSGLLTAARLRLPLTVVLINNGGGGIFEFLPAARHGPPFEEFLVAPHDHDLDALARAAGAEVSSSEEAIEIARWAAAPSEGLRVLEYRSDRKRNARLRRQVESALAPRLEAALEALRAR